MQTILLVRHGETDWNRSGQIMGDQPIPLNANGQRQAQQLAAVLKDRTIHAIVSSPVLRAVQTAEILAVSVQMKVTRAAGLREIGVGEWVNRYWKDLGNDPARLDYYTKPNEARPSGGETLKEVQQRAVASVQEACAANYGDSLLFVSHGDVIRTILAHYLRTDVLSFRQARLDNGSLTGLSVTDSGAELLFLNSTPFITSLK